MLWGKVKIDVVGAPRCECDECSCESETDELEISEGPYRGTVEAPQVAKTLARVMYEIATEAKEAARLASIAAEEARIQFTKDVVLPKVLQGILIRSKDGRTYAPIKSLTHDIHDAYDIPTLTAGLRAEGFSVMSVGAGGVDQVKWHFTEEDEE